MSATGNQTPTTGMNESRLASGSEVVHEGPVDADTPIATTHNNGGPPDTSNDVSFSPSRQAIFQPREGLAGQVGVMLSVPSAPSRAQDSQPTDAGTALRINRSFQNNETPTAMQSTSGSSAFDGEHHEVTAMGTVSSEDTTGDDLDKHGQFFGNSSAASFIREAYGRGIGDWGVSPRPPQSQRQPRSAATTKYRDSAKFTLPTRAFADHLMAKFRERVFYLYPVLHWPSFHKAYTMLWDSDFLNHGPPSSDQSGDHVGLGSADAGPQSAVFHCALNAVFALSCHFSDLDPPERSSTSFMFFLRSKALLGVDFLESDTLSVVQTLIIMALNLQGTSFPTRCWNSVGIACRLAQGLGLHAENLDSATTALETEIRRRVWHCCAVMDMYELIPLPNTLISLLRI